MSRDFTVTAAFPNGLMWLMSEDKEQLQIPDVDGIANFWTSRNAWGVAVQHDAEGEMQLSIGRQPPQDTSLTLHTE